MTILEQKRKEVELSRVKSARVEIEFRILEREDEVERLQEALKIQIDKEIELTQGVKNG